MKCDLVVVGGGSAGLAAAVIAARAGARVVLLERHCALGGMATAALVHTVCGLYRLREEPGALPAHAGFPTELAERLMQAGAAVGPVRMGRMDVLPHTPPGFAAVADQVAAECPSLEVRLHTELASVSQAGGSVDAVEVLCRGRRDTIEPRVVVDATGDATLLDMAGGETLQAPADRLQRPAFVFALHSVDVAVLGDDERLRVARRIAEAVAAGALDVAALGAHFRVTGRGSELYVTVDLPAPANYDPTAPAHLTLLEQTGRRLAVALRAFLREHHAAFRHAEFAAFPARIGVRESRRARGRAIVTEEQVLRGSPHPDVVALGTWPVELRERHTGPRWRFPDRLRPTQIPLDALRSHGLANVWIAGRCISCDHEAQAALRVIGTCLATGQAAGAAAALQARHGSVPDAAAVRAQIGMTVPAA